MSAPAGRPGPSFDLDGRTAVVTGGGRGLGRAMALALAAAGADVGVVSRSADELEGTAEAIRASGRRAWVVPFDLADPSRSADAAATVEDVCGPVDILVNAAGMQIRKAADELSVSEWERVQALNLTSPFFLSQEIGRRMRDRGRGGRIVFVASLTSYLAVPGTAAYAASKAGVVSAVRTLALEWAGAGIRVNGIAPGYFHTELTDELFRDPERRDWVLSRIPVGRTGEPEELGGAVVFLASAASEYVTGQVIAVDGGWLAA